MKLIHKLFKMNNYLKDFVVNPKKYYQCNNYYCLGQPPLMQMVETGYKSNILEIIRDYVQKNPSELDRQNEVGWSALMLICYSSWLSKSVEIIKLLLELGADVNLQDTDGNSALMLICPRADTVKNSIIELLIKSGANVNLESKRGHTSLSYVITCGGPTSEEKTNTIKLLLDAGAASLKYMHMHVFGMSFLDFIEKIFSASH